MSLDLDFNEEELAVADAVQRFCEQRCDAVRLKAGAELPLSLWRSLAEMGVLGVALPGAETGAMTVCAIMQVLGQQLFPGPLSATFLATQVLETSRLEAVIEGRVLVSVGDGSLMPWALQSETFIVIEGDQLWLAEVAAQPTAIDVLGGEVWGVFEPGQLQKKQALDNAKRGLTLAEIALSMYLGAAALRPVRDAGEYVQTRRQFKKPLADFQAVAHPLADCLTRLTAAMTLTKIAAYHFDNADIPRADHYGAAARLSASAAALETVHVCHQVFGAIGVTLEGPVYHITRRLRQLASQAPGNGPAREIMLDRIGMKG